MSGQYFVEQTATTDILKQVTNVCAECYDEIDIDDKIYYDMQNYRYICKDCYEEELQTIEKHIEIIDEEDGLFA